jgi:tetratricopeptide (TPR) repeat protein
MAKSSKQAAPGAGRPRRRSRIRLPGWVWLGLGIGLAGAILAHYRIFSGVLAGLGRGAGASTPASLAEEKAVFAQYGGSASCRSCHAQEYAAWEGSHHGLAEREVEAVLDRRAFDPARSFGHGVGATRVAWATNRAEVTSVGLSGKPETFAVSRVIGVDPLRQFLVPFPNGRFQALEAAYAPRTNDWFDVYGSEQRRPGEWGHWTGRGMNWNNMCAGCHNTRLRRNYDEATDGYHTTMAERGVGCEACHGPLETHNQWQQQFGRSGRKDPTLHPLSKAQVVDNCGSCHARRAELTGDFKPGDAFSDNFQLTQVDRTEVYYPDGQIHEEDYEYASFLSSRMHFRGVSCLDCHNPHTAKALLPGNWLCLRCHDGSYSNAPAINPVTHSHHRVYGWDTNGRPVNLDLKGYDPKRIQETGGECVNCHMPQTPYMQRHWRHDHGFTIPDPLLTKQFGIPNACNRCHQDKDAAWALGQVEQWYGPRMERPTRVRAQWLARARAGDPAAREPLLRLLASEEIPYWRAAAVNLLEPWADGSAVSQGLLRSLEDTNALVRSAAAQALETALSASVPGVEPALKAHLTDPSRNVRVAAAWSLRSVLDLETPGGRDLQQYLEANADQPAGQLQQADFCYARHDLAGAVRHLQTGLAWDPYSTPIRLQLAMILSELNRSPEALALLQAGCRLTPQDADLRYELGLAYNEAGDVAQAARQLEQAAQLNPRLGRAWYNLGLAQNALGQPEVALESLLRGEGVAPMDARIPYARATILARLGRTREAVRAVDRALEIQPAYPEAAQLRAQLTR